MSAHAPPKDRPSISRLFTVALRQVRGGLSGFYIFMACVALGVMMITAIGTVTESLRAGLESEGQTLLGGDVLLSRMHVRATDKELAHVKEFGQVCESASMRSTARRFDDQDQMLVEVKAVDKSYPLVGALELKSGKKPENTFRQPDSAAVDPLLLERLKLKIGDELKLGTSTLKIAAIIDKTPDGLTNRLTVGPRVLVSLPTLLATGLVQPGTLINWRYALKLTDDPSDETKLAALTKKLKEGLQGSGFNFADRRDPSPQLTRTLERLRQFLTLMGLTALLVGGVGIANAVSTFVDRQRKTIATFKSIGATNRQVLIIYLLQILAMAAIGIAIGLVLGFAIPATLKLFYGDILPIPTTLTLSPWGTAAAITYGFVVSLLFSLWPLGRTARISGAALFRESSANEYGWPPAAIVFATTALTIFLALFAIMTSGAQMLALYYCGCLVLAFVVFILLGEFVSWVARKISRPRIPELSLAIGNLGAPGGLTRSVILSLGAGLTVLVAVSLADASFVDELSSRLPENSPDYFVLDIKKGDLDKFQNETKKNVHGTSIKSAPMLRGRLIKLKGVPVEQIKAPPEAQWVLSGDRGITYAETLPSGTSLVEGDWWPKDYAGEPLVSFEADLAKQLNLKISDTVTVNVLGRDITARIANLRKVDWESLAINFVMVFSPNTLAGAPANSLATLKLPEATTLADEGKLARAIASSFPSVTVIRVRDAIDTFNEVFSKIMTAVRAATSVTLLAGAIVLAGALATAQRRRILEAAILSALGASRRKILSAHVSEYVILAMTTAGFAIGLGALASWLVLTHAMEVKFTFSWAAVALALGLSLSLVIVFGLLGTWTILRAKPVPYLRSE